MDGMNDRMPLLAVRDLVLDLGGRRILDHLSLELQPEHVHAIRYSAICEARSTLEMSARVSGRGDDRILIDEKAELAGEEAVGVLRTSSAVRDHALAHAIPIVEVRHPKAHVTHEAAIGGVDARQLETLMSRGLTEERATDLITDGLLSPGVDEAAGAA